MRKGNCYFITDKSAFQRLKGVKKSQYTQMPQFSSGLFENINAAVFI